MNKSKKSKSWAIIMKRELSSYFSSPVAYIVTAIFLVASGFLFFSTFFLAERAELRQFFEILPLLFSLFIPALTMRIFSEENKTGTIETLITLPVRTSDIVAGKFLASFVASISLLIPTISYVIACVLCAAGGVDFGPMIGGYLGAIFLASSFCAVGVFASSLTKNQIVAFFIGFAICAALTMVNIFSILLPPTLVEFLTAISATSHFRSISRGIIDSRDIIYFLSLTTSFIMLTSYSIDKERM